MSKKLAESLTAVLADTFVVYFKTHSFHWNVTGPNFKGLHDMFGEQYTEMWEATDDIAERIRAIGEYAPNSHEEMMKFASIKESGQMPDADGMCQVLAEDNHALVKKLKETLKLAEELGDDATLDMMVGRIQTHEKYAWMLDSSRTQ